MRNRHPLFALFATVLLTLPAAAQEAPAETPPTEAAPAPADAAPADDAPADDAAAGDAAAGEPATESAETAPDEGGEAAEEGASTPDPTEAPAGAEMGSLTISSTPAGKIFIDGEDTGLSTPLIDHAVPAGTHTVKVVDEASGRTKEITFRIESGAVLNLNMNLPEGEPTSGDLASSQPASTVEGEEEAAAVAAAVADEDDWTWMTVAGWASLGVGTLGLLAGAVILTTPTDPNQGPLGFGLFGAGAGLVLGGGVLLYLDSELADSGDDPDPAAEGGEEEGEASAGLFGFSFSE